MQNYEEMCRELLTVIDDAVALLDRDLPRAARLRLLSVREQAEGITGDNGDMNGQETASSMP